MNGREAIPLRVEENSLEKMQNSETSASSDASGEKKVQFSGSCSFLVSLLGYSMGTSDFWRFPYLVFRNGGGVFLIPFTLFMLLAGLPMMFFEVSVSQFSGKGPLRMWDIAPFFKGIGYTFLVINLLNNVYYNILRSWILEYLVNTFKSELPWEGCKHEWNRPGCIDKNGEILTIDVHELGNDTSINHVGLNVTKASIDATNMTAAEQFWQYKVLQLSPGLDHLDGVIWNMVLFAFLWRLLVFLCMVRSIKSIEKVMFATVFIPITLMIVIWIRSLMLDGSTTGMLYYITPNMERLSDPRVWLEAAMMACYTLGPGWGTIPMIGSHNKFHGNTIRFTLGSFICVYAVISTVADILSAVMNGLICFSVLGVMAHDSGLDLEKTVTSGLSLGFTVYPTAFTYFPLPQIWSAVFFVALVLVGLDAQILSAETVMNCLEEMSPNLFRSMRRVYMIAILNVGFFLLTIPFCTRGGIYIFQLLDWYAAAWTLLFVCFIEGVVVTWVYGTDRLSKDIEIMVGQQLPTFIRISGAFVAPLIYLALLLISFIQYQPPTYGSYIYPGYAETLGWCLALSVISPIPLYFVYKVVRTGCSARKVFKEMHRPSDEWGPQDDTARADYYNPETECREFASTFSFNLTGKYRKFKPVTSPANGPLPC